MEEKKLNIEKGYVEPTNNDSDVVELEYHKPQLYKRVFANIIDFIFTFLMTLSLVTILNNFIPEMDFYKSSVNTLNEIKLASRLYIESDSRIRLCVDVFDEDTKMTLEKRHQKASEIVHYFFEDKNEMFFDKGEGIKTLNNLKNESGKFVLVDGEFELKPEINDGKAYDFYKDTIVNVGLGCLNGNTSYFNASKTIFYASVGTMLGSFLFCVIIFFYAIPLVWVRGRKTLGRAIFKISYLDYQAISLSYARFSSKFWLFFFLEIILSLFTFGVPLIVSATMLGFSKSGQCLSDYLSGTYAVNNDGKRVYKTLEEYEEINVTK